MARKSNRTAYVVARIAPDALALVRRAAELQGRSVSDFLVAAALKDAHQTIENEQIIRLSVDDQQRFAEMLLNQPPLAPAMKRAHGPQAPDCRREVTALFRVDVLGPDHARDAFSCDVEAFDPTTWNGRPVSTFGAASARATSQSRSAATG